VLPSVKGGKINASEEFELDGGCGSVKLFGRGSGITGNSLDVAILDDIYKDRAEALSPVIRSSAIEWYASAVNTRYHNNSQELIVFTRWHEEDLIGFLSTKKKFIYPKTFEELHHHIDDDAYFVINYEAIKTGEKTELDPREVGEPLFPERHSLKRLLEAKDYDEEVFQSLYQGDPKPKKGMLYSGFLTYASLPTGSRYCYVDVADGGGDYLCAVCGVKSGSKFFVTDVYYSKDKMEVTELKTAKMIRENSIGKTFVESNSGGRGFARQLEKFVNPENSITWFHQSGNKESRILSNATAVKNSIIFPQDWKIRFPDFYKHLHEFRSEYKSNSHDDAPDAITGIIEKIMSGADLAFKESSVFI
jgi:predicted phage terminase large subunit-like protein